MSTPKAFLAVQKRRLVIATWIVLMSGAPAIWYWTFGAPGKGHEILYHLAVLVALFGVTFMLLAIIQYGVARLAYPSEARQRLARIRRKRQVAMPLFEMSRPTAWVVTIAFSCGAPIYIFAKNDLRNVGASLFAIALGLVGIAILRPGIRNGCIGGRFDVSLDRKPGLFWLTVLWIGVSSAIALIYGAGYLLVSMIRLSGG